MIEQAMDSTVRTAVVVAAPVERAWAVFTERMDTWWPRDHHIIEAPLERMVLEPRVGGHVYDVGTDGSTCRWSRVLAYEPPHRLVLSWDIDPSWKFQPDPERTSEIEVRFTPEGDGSTRVELEHRHLERHGDGWEKMRAAVGSPGGWRGTLEAFETATAADR